MLIDIYIIDDKFLLFFHSCNFIFHCNQKAIACFGVTKDPNTGDYMLVMYELQMDLRSFVKQNYSTLKWKDVYNIFWNILSRIYDLHKDNIVHKDLHSGNVLQTWG